mmetsp:Transcript_23970/g.66584  ORF Transcript_23970/g.66584 Transcript_23970/m.66584 type:complete len:268 (+) Transcript_23970:599-1402(+)
MAMPTSIHDTITREVLSTLAVSPNELAPGSTAESGTKHSSKDMSAFWTHLSAILFSIFDVECPSEPFSTMKALTFPVATSLAHTTVTSANVPLPIHRLYPFSLQPPSTFLAIICMPAASLPCPGSVSAQQPTSRQECRPGRNLRFCSSVPISAMLRAARLLCTKRKVLMLASTRASSQMTSPAATVLSPGHPYPLMVRPTTFSAPSAGRRQWGNAACSQKPTITGATCTSTNWRTRSLIAVSSSVRSSSANSTSCRAGGNDSVDVVA